MINRDFVEKIEEMSFRVPAPQTVDLVDSEGCETQVLVTVNEDGGHVITPTSTFVTADYEQEKKRADVPPVFGVETLDAFMRLIPGIAHTEGFVTPDVVGKALAAEPTAPTLNVTPVTIHVQSPTKVVASLLEPDGLKRRRTLAVCSCDAVTPGVDFAGKWMSSEQMNILLQTAFDDEPSVEGASGDETERAHLMRMVGTLVEQQIVITKDDGVSQQLETRTELSINREVAPRLVSLRPYRTFRNLRQPASLFLLRVKAGTDKPGQPQLALFETDGGRWRLDAMKAIAGYLAGLCAEQRYLLLV